MIDPAPYYYTQDDKGWCMDWRHVDAIHRLVRHVEPRTIVEIGCWTGRSACAYVEAQKIGLLPVVHLVDIRITDELRKLVRKAPRPDLFVFHEGSSDNFRMKADIAVIDGDHNECQAAKDVGWATGWRVPWIVLHDVSAFPRMTDCKGSWMQGNELRRNPYYTVAWDDQERDGERTWRGLMVAGPERFSI